MAKWDLTLSLPEDSSLPRFAQIAHAVTHAIQVGRLSPGERLPGTRTLAAALGVHRNTVVAAYDELLAEGWAETVAAKGTFVAERLPSRTVPGRSGGHPPERPGFLMPRQRLERYPRVMPAPEGMIDLGGGTPDLSLVPRTELARAYRRVVLAGGGRALAYGAPEGASRLRDQLRRLLAEERGLVAGPGQLLVLRGSQMALYLLGQVLLEPGERVAVEALGYPPAWSALEQRAELVPIPVDAEGLDVDALARAVARHRIRAVYLTPHHQYPTTVVLSAARRLALLELARRERFAILEDDYDNEVHYRGRPVLPLASADRHGVVVYIGTLSKVLAPGLRLGFVVASDALIRRLCALRYVVDHQGDLAMERAVAELMEDGEVQRHARRMRRVYALRREALLAAVDHHLEDTLHIDVPDGGMAVWAHAPDIDVDAWAAAAEREGVRVRTARRFAFDRKPRPYLRLGFASVPEKRIEAAIRILAEVRPRP